MQEENLSERQSLEIIEAMINKAKNQISESGHLYLVWGWAVFICSIAQFILLYYVQYKNHSIVWISMWLVFFYQMFYLRKKRRQRKVRTYTDSIIGFVWLCFIIMMFLMVFLFVRISVQTNTPAPWLLTSVFLALYGMPTFLSGIILRFRTLIIGGACCWVLSIISSFIQPEFQLLLIPVAMIAAWIVPGYALQARFKQQNA